MPSNYIRPVALAIIWRGDALLVVEGHDPLTGQMFYRPLGGGIEFGERGDEAVIRELREELAVTITDPRYLGTVENIFTYNGAQGHELVRLYEARFADERQYDVARFAGHEDDGTAIQAIWAPLSDFDEGQRTLYPTGLLELLMKGSDDDADTP